MFNFIRRRAPDLPEFAYEDLVEGKPDMERYCADPTNTSMVRPVIVSGRWLGVSGLVDLLDKADQTFDRIADGAGIRVVGHTYGLTEVPAEDRRAYRSLYVRTDAYVPPGHIVVAEVDVVHDPQPIPAYDCDSIKQAVLPTKLEQDPLYWTDAGLPGSMMQYVRGKIPSSPYPETTLIDIEPRFKRNW